MEYANGVSMQNVRAGWGSGQELQVGACRARCAHEPKDTWGTTFNTLRGTVSDWTLENVVVSNP